MKMLFKFLLVVVCCLTLLAGCYLQQGGWMMMSTKYDESKLLGLSRADVISRLGPPSYDPQASATRPWNEAEDGPYYLGYAQGWARCGITFKDGKVDSVRRFWK